MSPPKGFKVFKKKQKNHMIQWSEYIVYKCLYIAGDEFDFCPVKTLTLMN